MLPRSVLQARGRTGNPVAGLHTVGSHGIAHVADKRAQLLMGVMLGRNCLASSCDCDAIIAVLKLVLSVIKPSTGKEFRALLLGAVYDNLKFGM